MTNDYPCTFLDCIPKKSKKGFILQVCTIFGDIRKLHTFDDLSTKCGKKYVYHAFVIEKEIPNSNGRTYLILEKFNRIGSGLLRDPDFTFPGSAMTKAFEWAHFQKDLIKTKILGKYSLFDNMRNNTDDYFNNPERYKTYNQTEVWDKLTELKKDVESFGGFDRSGFDTDFVHTYKPTPKDDEFKMDINKTINGIVDSVDRRYRTKMKFLTKGGLKDTTLTNILENGTVNYNIEDVPKTGISVYVDSAMQQVAFKERHIAEYYFYYAIMTFMRRTKRYPTTKVKNILPFIEAFINDKRIKKSGKAILFRLKKYGFISLSSTPKTAKHITLEDDVSIRSQQEYVSKHEAAWNKRQSNAVIPQKVLYNYRLSEDTEDDEDEQFEKLCASLPEDFEYKDDGNRTTFLDKKKKTKNTLAIDHLYDIHGDIDYKKDISFCHRPYFDIYSAKTCKMDSGFIHLLNAGKQKMMAWLYEGIVSSYDHHFCRTRLQMNLLIARSSQRVLERQSTTLTKRFNYLHIPRKITRNINNLDKTDIGESVRIGGKFKMSSNGEIYRQEGNTFKSELFLWKASKKCCRFRLSQKYIRLFKATTPKFIVSKVDNKVVTEKAFFDFESNGRVKVYAKTKKEMKDGKFFAMFKDGVATINSDPATWEGFEPLAEYDKFNGDLLYPKNSTIKKYARYSVKDSEYSGFNKGRNLSRKFKLDKYHQEIDDISTRTNFSAADIFPASAEANS